MKSFIRVFVTTALPYGVFMWFYFAARNDLYVATIQTAISTLFFGLAMASLFTLLKKIPFFQLNKNNGSVICRKELLLDLPLDIAFDYCLDSLAHMSRVRIRNQDKNLGQIEARKGINWKTFGDVISFKLASVNHDKTQIELESRPYVRSTAVDYGSNSNNVEEIRQFLLQKESACKLD